VRVGRKRVARLMRADGLPGVHRRSWRHATKHDPAAAPAPDLVNRKFTATAPDQLWVADVTYVPTVEGWLYLATVVDVFSRRVLGWSMDAHRKTQLVCDAVRMAVANRGGQVTGVVHHSDRGGEYTSRELEKALRDCGALASMGFRRGLLRQFHGRVTVRDDPHWRRSRPAEILPAGGRATGSIPVAHKTPGQNAIRRPIRGLRARAVPRRGPGRPS